MKLRKLFQATKDSENRDRLQAVSVIVGDNTSYDRGVRDKLRILIISTSSSPHTFCCQLVDNVTKEGKDDVET